MIKSLVDNASNDYINRQDKNGFTALMHAVKNNQVELLLDHSEHNFSLKTSEEDTIWHFLIDKGRNTQSKYLSLMLPKFEDSSSALDSKFFDQLMNQHNNFYYLINQAAAKHEAKIVFDLLTNFKKMHLQKIKAK